MAAKRIQGTAQTLGIRPVKDAVKGPRAPKGKALGMRAAKEAVKGVRK